MDGWYGDNLMAIYASNDSWKATDTLGCMFVKQNSFLVRHSSLSASKTLPWLHNTIGCRFTHLYCHNEQHMHASCMTDLVVQKKSSS